MILEPDVIVLYVNDLAVTSKFYCQLLGITPDETSPTFHSFTLSNGMSFALKAKHSVVPPVQEYSGHGELAFTLDSYERVDALFALWAAKKMTIIVPPTQLPYGYTFVALDPDGHRLRAVCLGESK
ncbi:VOC family protein [Legionella worsleiensis]|uniref:Bleomycin resistance protein n=1 Tax=Legionella worsleiensis TaxID=45076 RepID=A0A0W1AAB0_9GAMM|nr:VOC family protein [Legionella worsleiensis]KTD78298.1 bleomycin resistance protein [Legionella worsleiensis]STY32635.1 bleomycin resistance protein [Legionella worsleiensis]